MVSELDIDKTKCWGLFDGACQGIQGTCHIAGVLYSSDGHFVKYKTALGPGTNNWAEINSLLVLLRLATERDIQNIQIHGDSQ